MADIRDVPNGGPTVAGQPELPLPFVAGILSAALFPYVMHSSLIDGGTHNKTGYDMLEPKIDFEAPARLFRANSNFMQFGDGYRQVANSEEISTGSVADLLAQGRSMAVEPGKTLFINNVGHGHFFMLDEIETQQGAPRTSGG